jgi:hypothetical protein
MKESRLEFRIINELTEIKALLQKIIKKQEKVNKDNSKGSSNV